MPGILYPQPQSPTAPQVNLNGGASPADLQYALNSNSQANISQANTAPQGLLPNGTQPGASLPPGAVKSYFSNLLYNIGEMTKKQYGLLTDDEKQQMAIKNEQAQQSLNTQEGYRKAQEQLATAKAMEVTPRAITDQEAQSMNSMFGKPIFQAGQMVHPAVLDTLSKVGLQNRGKTDTATINQGVQVPVTDDMVKKFGLTPGSTIGAKAANQLATLEGKNMSTISQMIGGAPHKVIINKATGETLHDLGIDPTIAINQAKANAFADAKASLAPFQTFDADGNLVTISAKQAIATGVPAASAWNTLYGATGSTKSQGQAAGAVAQHIPAFQDAVRALDAKGELGPVMGRLNTYLAQGYGGNDKDIAEFVTTMGLLKSGAVRAHFGARGGAAILDKFDKNLNPAMTANDLIGSTDAINSFLTTYKQTGSNANTPKTSIGNKSESGNATHVYVPGKGITPVGQPK